MSADGGRGKGAGLGRREGRGCRERYGVILIVQWCGYDRLESDGT